MRERCSESPDDALHAALKLEAWTKDANERRGVETLSFGVKPVLLVLKTKYPQL